EPARATAKALGGSNPVLACRGAQTRQAAPPKSVWSHYPGRVRNRASATRTARLSKHVKESTATRVNPVLALDRARRTTTMTRARNDKTEPHMIRKAPYTVPSKSIAMTVNRTDAMEKAIAVSGSGDCGAPMRLRRR